MKNRMWIAAAFALAGFVCSARSGDTVEPQTVTATWVRGVGGAVNSSLVPYRGTTLVFTNCVLCTSSSTNIQGLQDVTVALRVGNSTTNLPYTATVLSTNAGTWFCSITVPELSQFEVQIKITDAATNVYIYPSKAMSTQESMF